MLTMLIINANGKHIGLTPVEKECAWKKTKKTKMNEKETIIICEKKVVNILLSKKCIDCLTTKNQQKTKL